MSTVLRCWNCWPATVRTRTCCGTIVPVRSCWTCWKRSASNVSHPHLQTYTSHTLVTPQNSWLAMCLYACIMPSLHSPSRWGPMRYFTIFWLWKYKKSFCYYDQENYKKAGSNCYYSHSYLIRNSITCLDFDPFG